MTSAVKLIYSENVNYSAENWERSVFQWEIDLNDTLCTCTPAFSPTKYDDTKLYIQFWFQRMYKGAPSESTSLKVTLTPLSTPPVNQNLEFEFSVSVRFSDGSVYKEYNSPPLNLSCFHEQTCVSESSGMYHPTARKWLADKLSTNKLTIKCEMVFFGQMKSPPSYDNKVGALCSLLKFNKNFETLYQSKELSDVSIHIGKETFKSHKFVLAAHSPVFKKMLLQDFQEAKAGVITISDFEPEIFEKFLKFLYTGQVEDRSFSNLKQLYSLADKYDVGTLKEECGRILVNSTTNEDQMDEVLQLAYLYKDVMLKQAAKKLLRNTIQK